MSDISIRNAKFAKTGLIDLIGYIKEHSKGSVRNMTMVEVGSYVGDSTRIFAEHFGKVISIDPYVNGYDDNDSSSYLHPMDEVLEQFKRNILDVYLNVEFHRIESLNGVSLFDDNSIDFIYLDGNHKREYFFNDVKVWYPKMKEEGWFGGHDYINKNAPEVQEVVEHYFKKENILRFADTSWLIKK